MMVTRLQPRAEGDLKLLKPIVRRRAGPGALPAQLIGWTGASVCLTAQLSLLSE